MTMRNLAALPLLLVVLTSCSYQGKLSDTAYVPTQTTSAEKLPSTLAIIDDGSIEKAKIEYRLPNCGFSLQVGEATTSALKQELTADFATVTTVDKPRDSDTNDFYAAPQFAWGLAKGGGCDEMDYLLGLRLLIIERQSRQVIADYRETAPANIVMPGDAKAAMLLGEATLFVLSPVTEPLKSGSFGKAVDGTIRESLNQLTHKIGDDIHNDRQLDTIASLGPVRDQGQQSAESAAYAKFIDAVVVVQTDKGVGSGFFVSADGLIVTCAHVVAGPDAITVKTHSGASLPATVVSADKDRDLAIIRVAGAVPATLALASNVDATVGHDVLAIGTPNGLSWTVSKGVVSAIRSVRAARVVQTDAAIHPGSSGGPLVDVASGRVLGITSFSEGPNVGFAIAADEVGKAFHGSVPGL